MNKLKNLENLGKNKRRVKRSIGVRKKIEGTPNRPRLSVFRSAKHIYVQAIDDASGKTLASASSAEKGFDTGKKAESAFKVGQKVGQRLKEKGVSSVIFDRNGFRYHGRVAQLAAGARESGLEF